MPYDIIIGRDKEDREKYGDKGRIYLGKGYVKMGNYTSLSNILWLDVIKSHVILIAGKRGSGKSYSIGVLAEELSKLPPEVRDNIAPLIFDTMGIFWTMKYRNDQDTELLEDWDLKAEELPANVWVPAGHYDEYAKRKIPVDRKFALAANELDIEDWLSIFELKMIDQVSVLIQKVVNNLSGNFDLNDIIENIRKDNDTLEEVKKSGIALFEAAKSWKVFATQGQEATKISELIIAGTTSILDLSVYSSTAGFNVRALIIGLVSKKLFNQRMGS